MKRKIKIVILFMLFFVLIVYQKNAFAGSKRQTICVTNIKGNYVYYYKCKVVIETPVITGKKHKAKITSKTKYYCYKNDNYDANDSPSKVSKKRFLKEVKKVKKWNKKGFYVMGTFKNGKCLKLYEPYWP